MKARPQGKQATAVLELKSRAESSFDEDRNTVRAAKREKAGVHPAYGMPYMKIQTKIGLVARREEQGVRRYAHLGSGNYNVALAEMGTDMGLFTAYPGIGVDVSELFNVMPGVCRQGRLPPCSLRLWACAGVFCAAAKRKFCISDGTTAPVHGENTCNVRQDMTDRREESAAKRRE